MRIVSALSVLFLVLALVNLSAQQHDPTTEKDNSPHGVRFVEVEPNVKLEVLDWGGTGRPLIFLAGLGFTAHSFDTFAPKFTSNHHVYGITRRGFGASSAPSPSNGNYASDRLGDDILAVMKSLDLDRPVLVGHSLAGEELSSVGSRYPEKISGLIYLDAGYGYAFYDQTRGDLILDSLDLKKKLDAFTSASVPDMMPFLQDLQADLARYEKEVQEQRKKMALMPAQPHRSGGPPPIALAISQGEQKYTGIRVPVLAIYADPHSELNSLYPNDAAARAAVIANDRSTTTAQADAFRAGVHSARVVLLPDASHFVFKSNEAEVIREMTIFLAQLQ